MVAIKAKSTLIISCALSILVVFAWLGASETVKQIAPAVVYTLLGLSLLVVIVGILALFFLGGETVWTKRNQLIAERHIANAKAIEAEAKAIEARVMVITAPKDHQLVVRDPDGDSDYRQLHLNPMPVVNGHCEKPTTQQVELYRHYRGLRLPAAPPGEDMVIEQTKSPNLLPAIRECENLLIVGGKGRGKTSFLQWLEYERLRAGETVITLDSHATPCQWQGRAIGAGREYSLIKREMISLVAQMDNRHKERTRGKDKFEPITQIIDEFTLLPGALKEHDFNVQDYSLPMLTEGRKVNMSCVWGIHSDRVKALGFEGLGDLTECFDAIIYLKKVQGLYYALVDFGEGKQNTRYSLPGPFIQPASIDNSPPLPPETLRRRTNNLSSLASNDEVR